MVQVECYSSSLINFTPEHHHDTINSIDSSNSTPTFIFHCVENELNEIHRQDRKRTIFESVASSPPSVSNNSESIENNVEQQQQPGPSSAKRICSNYYYKLAQETPDKAGPSTGYENDEEDASYDSLNERETGKFFSSLLIHPQLFPFVYILTRISVHWPCIGLIHNYLQFILIRLCIMIG